MSVSYTEICENTKMGREYALLGNYETSQVYYQAVLQQIQKLLTTLTEASRKQKWNQVPIYLLQPQLTKGIERCYKYSFCIVMRLLLLKQVC